MKKSIKKIIPAFIRNFDDYLIANQPFFWCSRIHFYIYFEVLILLFTLLITSFQSIDYSNIPYPKTILIYSVIINAGALLIWIVNQDLLKAKVSFGLNIKFHNLKVTLFFLFAFVLTANFTFIPFYYLNERAYNQLTEDPMFNKISLARHGHFALEFHKVGPESFGNRIRPLIGPSTSFSTDSVAADSVIKVDTSKMDTSKMIADTSYQAKSRDIELETYNAVIKGLTQSDIKNIALILFNEDALDNVSIITRFVFSGSSPKFLIGDPYYLRSFKYPDLEYRPIDNERRQLKIYYQRPVKQDSFYTDKFKIRVYHKTFKGTMTYPTSKKRDTLISRYYFLQKTDTLSMYYYQKIPSYTSRKNRKPFSLVIVDSLQLQYSLIENAILTSVPASQKEDYHLGRQRLDNFKEIKRSRLGYAELITIYNFIAIILSFIILLFYTIIRLFNIKKFVYSLILSILFWGGCIGINYLRQMPSNIDLTLVIGVFMLAIIAFLISKFSMVLLNILVLCFCSIMIFLVYYMSQVLPFNIYLRFSNGSDLYLNIFASIPLLLIMLPLFMYKLQKLYYTPK